jgi:selenocysteine lyase/cysteine desulfurase
MEMGTPPMMPVYAQLGGLEVLAEAGAERVHRETMLLAEDLIEHALTAGLQPRMAERAEERSAIVMLPSEQPHRDVARLGDAGIIVDARPGHVRVSPYFYNVADDHRRALEILARG